jgi:segregation and condensation protein A
MPEKTIPWWQRALIFALGGIRSGFGLFSRYAKTEPVREPEPSDRLKENSKQETVSEEETALTDPSTQPEIVAAESAPAAEQLVPVSERTVAKVEAAHEPVNDPAPEIVNESVSKPIGAAEPVAETEPEPEPAAPAIEEEQPANLAVSEPVAELESETVNETLPEPLEEAEPEIEAEPEPDSEPIPVPVIEQVIPAADPPSAPLPEPPPAVEPEPTPELAPDSDAVAKLVLTPQPTAEEAANKIADEKAAAKLAARQKKLDESSEESPFSVIVDRVYDGPLDLLLDLIRKQDIDIYDIPIAKITAQFLAYVNQLKATDVDVAGEFIYTASLLIHIKSKMLLPRAAFGPEDATEDPRRELVERLLEHERFKNAAQMLQQKQMLEAATWSNPGVREFKDNAAVEPEIAADTVDLVRIFRDILERARTRPVIDVSEDTVTVGQMIQFLTRRLTIEDKPVALRRLLSHTRSERALIAMFLALLELVRLQAILLRQDRQFSEIFIKKHSGFDAVMSAGLMHAHDDWR